MFVFGSTPPSHAARKARIYAGANTMADVAASVVFLLDNQSVNGVNLPVDGGWLLM